MILIWHLLPNAIHLRLIWNIFGIIHNRLTAIDWLAFQVWTTLFFHLSIHPFTKHTYTLIYLSRMKREKKGKEIYLFLSLFRFCNFNSHPTIIAFTHIYWYLNCCSYSIVFDYDFFFRTFYWNVYIHLFKQKYVYLVHGFSHMYIHGTQNLINF